MKNKIAKLNLTLVSFMFLMLSSCTIYTQVSEYDWARTIYYNQRMSSVSYSSGERTITIKSTMKGSEKAIKLYNAYLFSLGYYNPSRGYSKSVIQIPFYSVLSHRKIVESDAPTYLDNFSGQIRSWDTEIRNDEYSKRYFVGTDKSTSISILDGGKIPQNLKFEGWETLTDNIMSSVGNYHGYTEKIDSDNYISYSVVGHTTAIKILDLNEIIILSVVLEESFAWFE